MLTLQLRRLGNSLGVIIPKAYLEALRLHEHSKLNLEMDDGTLVLCPVTKKATLEELVAQMTPENTFPEISSGHAMGEEIIGYE